MRYVLRSSSDIADIAVSRYRGAPGVALYFAARIRSRGGTGGASCREATVI